ncbi:MAG: biopolymer transporter ExbD [Planctomycetes bacterium]|nr:biopolymer transporter ExbD [Planctomycetota bacterium]
MAPLIDMTFLLLIFFLVNTNFIKETGIEVKRPIASTGTAKSGDLILVGITSAGTVHMAGKRIDLASVRTTVSQMRLKMPKASVVIVADEGARAGLIVRVIDECKLAGADDISFATKTEGE